VFCLSGREGLSEEQKEDLTTVRKLDKGGRENYHDFSGWGAEDSAERSRVFREGNKPTRCLLSFSGGKGERRRLDVSRSLVQGEAPRLSRGIPSELLYKATSGLITGCTQAGNF